MSILDQTLSDSAVAVTAPPINFSPPVAACSSTSFQHFTVVQRADGSLHELGRGAMGVTYKAFDTQLGSYVALKVINPHYLREAGARERFLREARAAEHLNHANVATVFHLGSEDDVVFYAMQFVEGETVESLIKRQGPLAPRQALGIILQAAEGLAAANDRGLIHRDIKPANLMLAHGARDDAGEEEDLHVKVIDFGLAKSFVKDDLTEVSDNAPRHASLTGGGPIGTPYFMSPEQIDPVGTAPLDARSDIYSLGVTLWYLLIGKPPYQGTQFQVFSQHMSKPPTLALLHDAGVTPGIVTLIKSMLAKKPDERPANYRVLTGVIRRLLREEPATSTAIPRGTPLPLKSVPAEKTPLAAPAVAAGFPLSEILRHRGKLPPREAFLLLLPIAEVADALRLSPTPAALLTTASLRVEFAESPANLGDLPALAVEAWPAFTVRFIAPADAANLAGSRLPTAQGKPAHPLRQLGALTHELLNGAAPGPQGLVPVGVLSEQGNHLLRECLLGNNPARLFASNAIFIAALSETTAQSAAPALIELPVLKILPPPSPASTPIERSLAPQSSSSSLSWLWPVGGFFLFLVLAIGGFVWRKPVTDFVHQKLSMTTGAAAKPPVASAAPTPAQVRAAAMSATPHQQPPQQHSPPPPSAGGSRR